MHLKEDIRAAQFLAKAGRHDGVEPPDADIATELRALETVITGRR